MAPAVAAAPAKRLTVLPRLKYAPLATKQHLAEIYSQGWECALAKKEGTSLVQVTVWVRCKDFLNDALWAHVGKKTASVYGFSHGPADPVIDMTKLVLLVRDKTVDADKMLAGCKLARTVIRAFELKLGFLPRTRLYKIENVEKAEAGEFAFISSGKWLIAPPLISLYGCLARAGRYLPEEKDPIEFIKEVGLGKTVCPGRDASYLQPSVKRGLLDKLLEGGVSLFSESLEENYSAPDVNSIHYSGIQAWGNIMGTPQASAAPYKFWK